MARRFLRREDADMHAGGEFEPGADDDAGDHLHVPVIVRIVFTVAGRAVDPEIVRRVVEQG